MTDYGDKVRAMALLVRTFYEMKLVCGSLDPTKEFVRLANDDPGKFIRIVTMMKHKGYNAELGAFDAERCREGTFVHVLDVVANDLVAIYAPGTMFTNPINWSKMQHEIKEGKEHPHLMTIISIIHDPEWTEAERVQLFITMHTLEHDFHRHTVEYVALMWLLDPKKLELHKAIVEDMVIPQTLLKILRKELKSDPYNVPPDTPEEILDMQAQYVLSPDAFAEEFRQSYVNAAMVFKENQPSTYLHPPGYTLLVALGKDMAKEAFAMQFFMNLVETIREKYTEEREYKNRHMFGLVLPEILNP